MELEFAKITAQVISSGNYTVPAILFGIFLAGLAVVEFFEQRD